jgi:non-canonical poly(A) RNA polymerase PAPD5/7
LHKEIIDFYEWVRPQDFEAEVRRDILRRLSLSFNQIEPGVLKAFGSYAADLYLPTGDMDLVFLQHGFRPGQTGKNGLPPPPSRSLLSKFARRLNRGLARPGSVQLIPWAKVPIVKFVDQVSGIRVDLSFNNDTGITANETFQKWKSQYPAMPILVSIIKQFLMLRGLNDVATGGLGGFSIICLVTSLVQHMPGANPPSNLGQMLVEFFNMYGNLIDKETVAIRLDPPGYIDKVSPHNRELLVADSIAGHIQAASLQQRERWQVDHHRSESAREQHLWRNHPDRHYPLLLLFNL